MTLEQQEDLHALCLKSARITLAKRRIADIDYRDVATDAYLRCMKYAETLPPIDSPQGRTYVYNTVWSIVVDQRRLKRHRCTTSLDAFEGDDLFVDETSMHAADDLAVLLVLEDTLQGAPDMVRQWFELRMSDKDKRTKAEIALTPQQKSAIYRWLGLGNGHKSARIEYFSRIFAW